jgi:hypothetical protein
MKKDIGSLRWFQPINLLKYPHLLKDDCLVWDSFLRSESSKFYRFAYDVPLIEESHPNPLHPDYAIKDWDYLTAMKIDAIGEDLDSYQLFEVKQQAGFDAIGQILSYGKLFELYYNVYKRIKLNIVAKLISPQLKFVAKSYNIDCYEVLI